MVPIFVGCLFSMGAYYCTFEEENFDEFCSFVAICESFSLQNLGAWHPWHGTSEHFVKVFSVKIIIIFHQFAKVFSLESFPLYGIPKSLVV